MDIIHQLLFSTQVAFVWSDSSKKEASPSQKKTISFRFLTLSCDLAPEQSVVPAREEDRGWDAKDQGSRLSKSPLGRYLQIFLHKFKKMFFSGNMNFTSSRHNVCSFWKSAWNTAQSDSDGWPNKNLKNKDVFWKSSLWYWH